MSFISLIWFHFHKHDTRHNLHWLKTYAGILKGDRGAVESALVLIPTLLLFLGILQISGSALARMNASNATQGQVSRIALLDSQETTDGLSVTSEPLPGGGEVVVGTRNETGPAIFPMIIGSDAFTSTGIAINENK
jgi:hypothetical protein